MIAMTDDEPPATMRERVRGRDPEFDRVARLVPLGTGRIAGRH
jgi:hypothetical protein